MIPLLLLTANAFALDHELTFEMGTLANPDPAFDVFSRRSTMPSRGLRGVVALNETVGLSLGWQHSGRGATVGVGAYEDERSYGYTTFQAALRSDQFSIGPVADYELLHGALAPYLRADLVVLRSTALLTDGRTSDPTELREDALGTGVAAMAGLAVNIPGWFGVDPTVHLEAGTTEFFAPMQFDSFGAMRPGGFTFRAGVGLRY